MKVKGDVREDVVVVGYLPSEKRPFRSLHCAVEENGRLRYVGGVGTGFDAAELDRAKERLDRDRLKGPAPEIDRAETAPKGLVWVKPKWRIEVRTGGWTGDGNLRQARFLGWREDGRHGRASPPFRRVSDDRDRRRRRGEDGAPRGAQDPRGPRPRDAPPRRLLPRRLPKTRRRSSPASAIRTG